MTTIDLQAFCFNQSDFDPEAPTRNEFHLNRLGKPFSHGPYTYATNGMVAIRVPRQADAPAQDDSLGRGVTEVFDDMPSDGQFTSLPTFIPQARPDQPLQVFKVAIGWASVNAKYLRLIRDLPDVKVACGKRKNNDEFPAITFTFTGGEGRIMPLREYDGAEPTPSRAVKFTWINIDGSPGEGKDIELPQALRLAEKFLNEGAKSITISQ